MKRMIVSSTLLPDGGDHINYDMFYAGPGYASRDAVVQWAREHGYTHIYYGSDEGVGYRGMYNGSTYVVYDEASNLPDGYREDAEKFGQALTD